MTEPPVKKRILTKVRKQYLHTRPSEEDGIGDHAELPPTPEQLNEDTIRLLDPSLVLVETNRNIYAGQQFLNLNYKVTGLKVDRQFGANVVSLDLKVNNVDILPLEYCVKRLKSYGDLELATWADRLVTYQSNYNQAMKKYFEFVNSANPMVFGALTLAKEHALSIIKDIESKYVYRKGTVYGSKNGLVPVSLTFHEGLIKYMDYNLDNFTEMVRDNGVPSLFKKDCSALIDNWKQAMTRTDRKAGLNQEGETFTVELYTKEGEKKSINMKVLVVICPGPEGFFVHHYSVFEDPALNVINNTKISGQNFESLDDKKGEDGDSKCKKIKKRNSEISNQISEVKEEETKVNSSVDM